MTIQEALKLAYELQSGTCDELQQKVKKETFEYLVHHKYIQKCCGNKMWFLTDYGKKEASALS